MASNARVQLDAVEAHLVQQQRDRRRHRHEPAGLPPMPTDPLVCRWCGGKRKLLIADDPKSDFCPSLCAGNDDAPFREQCAECRREFHTGARDAVICFDCDSRERAALALAHRGPMATRDKFGETLRRYRP